MVGTDAYEAFRWLSVPSPPVLASCSTLVFHQGTSGSLVGCNSQVELATMTVLQFLHCPV